MAEYFKHLLNIGGYVRNGNIPIGWAGWMGCYINPYLENNEIVENENAEHNGKKFETALFQTIADYISWLEMGNIEKVFSQPIERSKKLLRFVNKNKNNIKNLIHAHCHLFPDKKIIYNYKLLKENWNEAFINDGIETMRDNLSIYFSMVDGADEYKKCVDNGNVLDIEIMMYCNDFIRTQAQKNKMKIKKEFEDTIHKKCNLDK